MNLTRQPSYPTARSYVVKLHRDADPVAGVIRGRLEHIPSGHSVDFASGGELLACLQAHASVTPVSNSGAEAP